MAARSDMADLRYITRLDYKRSRGYWVRYKQRSPIGVQKFFSDSKFGGARGALRNAIAFRDALLKKNPNERYGMLPNPGTLKVYWKTQGPWQYRVWGAEIQIASNERLKRSWSVSKYGEEVAKKKAESWLKAQQKIQRENYDEL